jgi:hypothetical protein
MVFVPSRIKMMEKNHPWRGGSAPTFGLDWGPHVNKRRV